MKGVGRQGRLRKGGLTVLEKVGGRQSICVGKPCGGVVRPSSPLSHEGEGESYNLLGACLGLDGAIVKDTSGVAGGAGPDMTAVLVDGTPRTAPVMRGEGMRWELVEGFGPSDVDIFRYLHEHVLRFREDTRGILYRCTCSTSPATKHLVTHLAELQPALEIKTSRRSMPSAVYAPPYNNRLATPRL